MATYAPLAQAGLQATTQRVQEMHHAIADKTFHVLEAIPAISLPSRWVHAAHDAITDAVYAGVRRGGSALLALAEGVERARADSSRPPQPGELALRSALNGVFGDHLERTSSPWATRMEMLVDGVSIDADDAPLPRLKPRVAVFIHGLACDERSWSRRHDAWHSSPWAGRGEHYGALLAAEEGMSPLFLRYNSGLAVEDNGAQLAQQLSRLMSAAPHVQEIVLVGHSMGGLVARIACERGIEQAAEWTQRVALVICLGSPHRGAPLEQLGQLATAALGVSTMTRPLAHIASARSRGIKDLRRGLRDAPMQARVPLRMVSGGLARENDGAGAQLADRLLGDGLVRPGSAADHGRDGDVQRVQLRGLRHMSLLHHPRVYALIRDWVRAAKRLS